MAFEPRRPLPATDMRVHAGRQLAKHLEGVNIGLHRLDAAFPFEEYDIAWARKAIDGDTLNQLSV